MFKIPSLVFLAILILIDIIWLVKVDKESRIRGLMMVGVIVIFATVWTFTQLMAHTRWVETGPLNYLNRASIWIEVLVLGFNVTVEIALAYLPYYAIPSMIVNREKRGGEKKAIH